MGRDRLGGGLGVVVHTDDEATAAGESDALVAEAKRGLTEASRVKAGYSTRLDTLQADQAAKQVELDQTFFLNFGKKGELKDAINALKKEAKEVSKQLEGAAKVEGKAQDAFDKQSEAAAKQADVAAKVVADAVKQSEKIEADAAKKADKIVSDAQKAAAAAVKEADKAAATLRRAAAVAAKAEAKLVR